MIRCLNLAKCLFHAGSVTQLDKIDKIQHRQVISDETIKRAVELYKAKEEEKLKTEVKNYSNKNIGETITENSIYSEDEG